MLPFRQNLPVDARHNDHGADRRGLLCAVGSFLSQT